jgi:type IV secretory pathway VirB2 component (pilin)
VSQSQATSKGDNGTGNDFIVVLDNILGYLIGLLYFVAIVFALYGGFQILTAGGDEEKVKKGKTTLIQAVIGLVVIFLASSIVRWIIDLGTDTSIVS